MPVVVLWRFSFPCFKGISGGLGSWNPEFTICPFLGLFELPKHYVLKGKWPILKRKILYKTGEKTPQGQMVPISRVYNPPPPYMREIGTMWQIGVLTGKPCTFLVQNRSFSAFWHYKNKERLSKGLDIKWHIPSTCLDASRKWFSTGIYSINRAFEWLCLRTQQTPQNDQNVHGFQVKTPICHIVPVSRAYPSPSP